MAFQRIPNKIDINWSINYSIYSIDHFVYDVDSSPNAVAHVVRPTGLILEMEASLACGFLL